MLAPIASKVRPRQPATASEGAPCARAKGRMAPATAEDVLMVCIRPVPRGRTRPSRPALEARHVRKSTRQQVDTRSAFREVSRDSATHDGAS